MSPIVLLFPMFSMLFSHRTDKGVEGQFAPLYQSLTHIQSVAILWLFSVVFRPSLTLRVTTHIRIAFVSEQLKPSVVRIRSVMDSDHLVHNCVRRAGCFPIEPIKGWRASSHPCISLSHTSKALRYFGCSQLFSVPRLRFGLPLTFGLPLCRNSSSRPLFESGV